MRILLFLIAFYIPFQAVAGPHDLQNMAPYAAMVSAGDDFCEWLLEAEASLTDDQVEQILGTGAIPDRGREAIKHVAQLPPNLSQRSLIIRWERLALHMISRHGNAWNSRRYMGTDSSVIYIGVVGYVIVIKDDGSIYKGVIRYPSPRDGDLWNADYNGLTRIREPSRRPLF